MTYNGLKIPADVRDLATTGIDNMEKAFALFFDAAIGSINPRSTPLALIKRVVAVKMDYARKIAHATDVTEATALQFAYCRAQIEIATDLIRMVSDMTNGPATRVSGRSEA